MAATAGKEDGGLTRRVRPSHDHHGLALARLRLDFDCRVADAGALEGLEPVDCQPAIAGSGRDDKRAAAQAFAAAELDRMVTVLYRERPVAVTSTAL
jgi:hypothetical protein